MEFTFKEYKCGCSIDTDNYGDFVIEYCPKHKAAPAMYEALLFAKEHLKLGYQLHRTHPGMIVECKEPKCKELVETNEVIAKAIAEVEKGRLLTKKGCETNKGIRGG